jgi:PEP-CTERM/exosortase A-associated glycosyltransferase
MKILHILDHSLPLQSGYTFRSQNIFRAQRKRGWEPVALTSPKHEESWKGQWQKFETIDGYRYYRTGSVSRNRVPIEAEIRLMAALGRRIREIVEVEKPDILHAHSPILNAIPALWTRRKKGIPIVYEIRAFWEDAAVDHGTYSQGSWKYKLVKAIETWVCRKADHVSVLCSGIRDDLLKRGIPSDKLTVVRNGVNLDDFHSREPDREYREAWRLTNKKVGGFIGSFYRYEGLDLLLDAFAGLSRSRSDVALLLIGGGEMEEEVKTRVKRLHLEGKAILPGRIPHERIPGVYALIDILAYPRTSMRLTELVTPLKPLETMAMGKALVASDIGGHRELIQHGQTGLLFPAGDVEALKRALEMLLDDNDFRQRLGTQAAARVYQEHPWDKTTAGYAEVYARALEKNTVS